MAQRDDGVSWRIQPAQIDWQAQPNGAELPVSRRFGDVYFSREDGLAEAEHVFLQGNDLPSRLAALGDSERFVVGETGFGTGLNLLALWRLWRRVRPDNHSQLHVVTVEFEPLSRADLTRALLSWPALADLSACLLAQYPPLLPGIHRLIFVDERLTVDLCWGDARVVLPELAPVGTAAAFTVQAWFLDGFAPSCNPSLWHAEVFAPLLRISGPGTTFASFSVAGVVKTALRDHGMVVTRPRGFGRKRQMLKAWWPHPKGAEGAAASTDHVQPCAAPARPSTLQVAVVGAGIAGLCCADSLARRGHQVTLIDQTGPLSGASGNPRALLLPKFTPLSQVSHHVPTLGWLHSVRHWSSRWPGLLAHQGGWLISTPRQPLDAARLQAYPADVVQVDADGARAWVPQATLIDPQALAAQVLAHPRIALYMAEVTAVASTGTGTGTGGWRLSDRHGAMPETFDQVVVCTALHAGALCPTLPALRPVRGQVSWTVVPFCTGQVESLEAKRCGGFDARLNTVLGYGGYAAPLEPNALLLGASFVRGDCGTEVRAIDHRHNLARLQEAAPALAAALPPVENWHGRASVRAQTRHYLPVLGRPHAKAPWVLTGLGSKGFAHAPLCAEILCALMLGEPVPLPFTALTTLLQAHFDATQDPSP